MCNITHHGPWEVRLTLPLGFSLSRHAVDVMASDSSRLLGFFAVALSQVSLANICFRNR